MRVIIIGGVAGGASCAARLRRIDEDAEIVMVERGPYISFANCGLPYHIGGEIEDRGKLVLQHPEAFRVRFRIDVRVETEALSIDREAKTVTLRDGRTGQETKEPYDKLVLSPGAAPIRPPLPGIDHPRVMTLRNIPDMDRIKAVVEKRVNSAVVIGGGFIGLEMAENLKMRGIDVTIVEMLDQVMPPLDREMTAPLEQELRDRGIAVRLETTVEGFEEIERGLRIKLKGGGTIETDLAILSVGVAPESDLAKQAGLELGGRGAIRVNRHMQTSDPDVYAVGDAVETRDAVLGGPRWLPLAGPANRQGRVAADHICGRPASFRGVQGTNVVRVFSLTAGSTGAAEKVLQKEGAEYRKVYLHPAQHVGYFPGAKPMTMKILFEPESGRLLGAQVVGLEGVDKRIDVLAMAIQARMTVFDLEEAELAYAPPYGSAKDPVNMAGFIAANWLRGDTEIVSFDHLEELRDGAVVLDVRTEKEFAEGSVPGAVNIPVDELRERLDELPSDRQVYTYCGVGYRAYLAERILKQSGYRAANLAGGYKAFRLFREPHNMT